MTITDIEGAVGATGTVVVIDVIRAFTTAAHALAVGADGIICVEGLDEARSLRPELSGALLMGEERGLRPLGFDFGNEPSGFDGRDLSGATMIQRTSNGTRVLAAASGACGLLAAAAVDVSATARWLADHDASGQLTLVVTGLTSEDRVTAEHLAALVNGEDPDPQSLRVAVEASADEHVSLWTRRRHEAERRAFLSDIDRCAAVDRFDFAMVADRDPAGRPVLRRSCV